MIHCFPPLRKAVVIKRPSAVIKSPYVADIRLDDGTLALCHTPGLGAGGFVEAGRTVYVSHGREGSKTSYTTECGVRNDTDTHETLIGLHAYKQSIAHTIVTQLYPDIVWNSEVTIGDSRFDFVGSLQDKQLYLEVKTALVSQSEDVPRTERCALFPVGYKKRGELISPRALKHVNHLASLLAQPSTHACILLFLVARSDCESGFSIHRGDPIYYDAVVSAVRHGVQVRAFALDYTHEGIRAHGEVPVWLDVCSTF